MHRFNNRERVFKATPQGNSAEELSFGDTSVFYPQTQLNKRCHLNVLLNSFHLNVHT